MRWKGQSISYHIYGESHSPEIGIEIEGLPKSEIDLKALNDFMSRRKASANPYSTSRIEPDEIVWKEGLRGNEISGRVAAAIMNVNVRSGDYNELEGKPRPSHADYASFVKFGRTDFRGGREFSARMTAPLCILGGIAKQLLEKRGIRVYAYVERIGGAVGKSYRDGITEEEILAATKSGCRAISNREEMLAETEGARRNLDSVGGAVECVVFGLPAGVGYTMAEGLESAISTQVFSVPAVKGIEFGAGFELAKLHGSEANDEFYYDGEEVKTYTNNAGGINGGISNGMPITLRVAMRPTPSIARAQRTVDLINKSDTVIEIKGRHDACIVPRAVPVIEGAVAIALLDCILQKETL